MEAIADATETESETFEIKTLTALWNTDIPLLQKETKNPPPPLKAGLSFFYLYSNHSSWLYSDSLLR